MIPTSLTDEVHAARRLGRWTWSFVALGVFVRVFRYAMDFPLWHDEAALAANFLDRDYLGLLQPLEFYQVAPPLFLWVELTAVKLFGFSEYSLRIFPLACGVASLFLVRRVAWRLLGPLPTLLTVGIFAVAPHLIEHATSVKPYASDLLVALLILSLAVDWSLDRDRSGPLWRLAIVATVALGLSHPAIFVVEGVALALLVPAWRTGLGMVRLGALAALVAPALSFVGLFVLVTGPQCSGGGLDGMRDYWADSFPPIGEPFRLLRWLILTHTGQMFAYPEGGRGGESSGTALLCVVALASLWRRRQRTVLALIVAPFGLTLIAAALRRYPYGGEARISQHLAPMICLMAGLGAAVILKRLPRPRDGSRGLALAMIGLFVLGVASVSRDWAKPYRTIDEQLARDFSRWFWNDQAREAELTCSRAEFGVREPKALHFTTATYVCYREISRPSPPVDGPRLRNVTADHPLRCVVFDEFPLANPSFVAFRDTIVARFPLRSVERFVVGTHAQPRRMVFTVFEFAPRAVPERPITTREIRWSPAGVRMIAGSRKSY